MDQTNQTPGLNRRLRILQSIRRFRQAEDGNMIILTLFLLVLMLIIGGMSVDFMRFESRRTLLQGTSDRAALAAANLRHTADPKDVAIDYFAKAGLDQYLVGDPIVDSSSNYRSVEINSEIPLSTFFLKMVGIDQLEAGAASKAEEGVGNIEISLILDISGSMREYTKNANGTTSSFTRIEKLREAATAFVTAVLDDDFKDKISVSMVPYSQQVNIGPRLFNALTTNHRHDFSYCLEVPDSEFASTAFSTSLTYDQSQHVQFNGGRNGSNETENTICPRYDYEEIVYLTQDLSKLTGNIAQFQPRAGTAIFLALKWGVALLDPSLADKTSPATSLDNPFDNRPVAFATDENPNDTEKIIVLMTDGQNDNSWLLKDFAYDSPSDYAHWNVFNWPYYRSKHLDNDAGHSDYWYQRYTYANSPYNANGATDGNTLMTSLCTAAKNKGIIIYAIAFEATTDGQTAMSNCASSPNHYYASSGEELTAIFKAIADQITDLRLTL